MVEPHGLGGFQGLREEECWGEPHVQAPVSTLWWVNLVGTPWCGKGTSTSVSAKYPIEGQRDQRVGVGGRAALEIVIVD